MKKFFNKNLNKIIYNQNFKKVKSFNQNCGKKLKIYISSPIIDYVGRRDAAEKAIMELNKLEDYNFEVIRIESGHHPAENRPSQEVCKEGVRRCDIYIGIFPKNRYGTINPSSGKSITHEEFDYAIEYGKCRLVFVENTKDIDKNQEKFLKHVGDYVEGRFWNEFEEGNLDELKYLVYISLKNLMKSGELKSNGNLSFKPLKKRPEIYQKANVIKSKNVTIIQTFGDVNNTLKKGK
jgi:hypothetical protein